MHCMRALARGSGHASSDFFAKGHVSPYEYCSAESGMQAKDIRSVLKPYVVLRSRTPHNEQKNKDTAELCCSSSIVRSIWKS